MTETIELLHFFLLPTCLDILKIAKRVSFYCFDRPNCRWSKGFPQAFQVWSQLCHRSNSCWLCRQPYNSRRLASSYDKVTTIFLNLFYNCCTTPWLCHKHGMSITYLLFTSPNVIDPWIRLLLQTFTTHCLYVFYELSQSDHHPSNEVVFRRSCH